MDSYYGNGDSRFDRHDGFGISDDDRDEMYGELDRLFIEFLEEAMADPTGEFGQVCNEIASGNAVSDFNMKRLKDIANKEDSLSPEEAYFVSMMAGRDDDSFGPFDDDDDNGATEEQMEKYAEYLRNYLYTYKDEAQEVDPSIDPEEEHAGPMAQDIEKVAPDCVKETPEGVKTVDGNRLALVNAGVIGELSRRVLELEEKLNGNASD